MGESENILTGYSDQEKGAYLGAIASIATADRSASEDEINYLQSLTKVAALSPEQEAAVVKAARDMSADELRNCLMILKNSKLKFSLIADIITFARVDKHYTEDEEASIKKIADYLQVDQNQFTLLDQFANIATEREIDTAEVRKPGFFESLGLKDKLEKAGINVGSLSKGLVSMLGPMVLSSIVSGGLRRRVGIQPGNQPRIPSLDGGFGGLGSIFSMLNNKGVNKGIGSILPKIFS